MYDASLGDHSIGYRSGTSTGGIESSSSFNQWYNDVEDVNIQIPFDFDACSPTRWQLRV